MAPYEAHLLGRLSQQTLRDDVGHVVTHDPHLDEPGLDPLYPISLELERRVREEALLHPGDEPEPGTRTELAGCPQEIQVVCQSLGVIGAKVVKQLVQDEQHALSGMHRVELRHHVLEHVLVVAHKVRARDGEIDTDGPKMVLELSHHEVAQRMLPLISARIVTKLPATPSSFPSSVRVVSSWTRLPCSAIPATTDMMCDFPVP